MDQLVHSYMSKRRSNRWPVVFFMNMLDVAGVAALVIWLARFPQWNVAKKFRRRLFLQDLGESLVEVQLH